MQMTMSAVLRYVTASAGIYRVGNSIGISRMQDAAQFGALLFRERYNYRVSQMWPILKGLKYPKSTVAYVIKKWKVSGNCWNVPRVGGPTKLPSSRSTPPPFPPPVAFNAGHGTDNPEWWQLDQICICSHSAFGGPLHWNKA